MAIDSAKQISDKLEGKRVKVTEKLELGFETLGTADTVVSVSTPVTFFDTTDGNITASMANGYPGQIKILYHSVRPGSNTAVITVTITGGTALTFDVVSEYWIGIFYAGYWWTLIGTAAALT